MRMRRLFFSELLPTVCLCFFILNGCNIGSDPGNTDTTAPTVGTAITFSDTTSTGTTISWGAASDNMTQTANLQYEVVQASTGTTIDSVSEALSATVVMTWATAVTSYTVTGLTAGTAYYFAVLVKDNTGNINLYTPASVTTLTSSDATAPTVGTGVTFSGTTSTGTTVSWGAATDDVTAASGLSYKVVFASSSTAIDTVNGANAVTTADGGLAMDWTSDTLTINATGLSAGTAYYFAVLVKDAAGNMSLYAPVSVTTLTSSDTTAPTVGTAVTFSETTSTGTTVSWGVASDDVTAASGLSYKVVRASASTDIDTVSEAAAVTTADNGLVMGWTVNTLTAAADALSAGTTYYFAVLVKDAVGNMSLYTPASVTTQTSSDTTAPTIGTAVTFSGTTSTGTTVSWGAASDDVTAASDLSYKLVRASTSAAIDTVVEADEATTVMTWTVNTLTASVTGLSDSTTYYFAVLVKDAAGNMSLYVPASVTTTDGTAPVSGTAISFSGTNTTGTTISWGAASDNETAVSGLSYKVVQASSSSAIDTVSEIDAATTVMAWTVNTLTTTVTGLTAGTTYYFAVLVKDAAGNMSLYAPASVTTLTSSDTTAPTVGTAITFSGTSTTGTTVNWGAASDTVTTATGLSYKVVRASTSAAIDTVSEADSATTVMAWTVNTLTTTVTGLTADTTYYFAVLVKDAAGNISLYAPASVTTLTSSDTTAPTVGTAISFSGTSTTGTTVNWGAASDTVTAATSLSYKVVRASASTAIDTVSEADSATTVMAWTVNTLTAAVTGLSDGTTYYFAVLVKDAAGNMSLYAPASVTTIDGTGPTVGTAITFSGTSTTGTTVNWGAASDTVTTATSLSYKVVRASASTAIDTVSEADSATTVMAWTVNTLTTTVTGLTAGTTYYFAVLVKDAAGNESLYAPVSVTTVAVGNVSITFTAENPDYQAITFSSSTVSIARGNTLNITTSNTTLSALSGWEWYVDNVKDTLQTSAAFSWDTTGKQPGQYIINTAVTMSGIKYSGSLTVTVTY